MKPRTKGLTGVVRLDDDVLAGEAGSKEIRLPIRWFPGKELIQWTKEVSAGAEPSFVGGMTTDPRGVFAVRRRFCVRNGYGLPCGYFLKTAAREACRARTKEDVS